MKLALCLEYPIDQHGGTEVLVRELVNGLSAKHQVLLVSGDTDESIKKSSVSRALSGWLRWDPAAVSVTQARQLADQLKQAGVDLAHFHFGGNYGWGNRAFNQCPVVHLARRGTPCVSTNHGAFSIMDGYCGPQRSLAFKLALFPPAWLSKQYMLAHVRAEVAVSQHDYHAVHRWYPLMRRKFRWIYHSQLRLPIPASRPAAERRQAVLCVGTIGSRKGQPVLVDAFCRIAARHPAWQLVLIGRCGDAEMMRQMTEQVSAQKLNGQVQFLGGRTDAEVKQWLDEAAIFAMPSFQEGLGLSLQEAQFHGCACVASAAGGVVDLIQHDDNGLLVPVGEPGALADALDRLMRDDSLRARLSRRAPQSVLDKEMTAERMVEKYQTLYENILKAA
jgi:glycosyltransferase involved in cell wall biosynthesis